MSDRPHFFARYAQGLGEGGRGARRRVLELGSGPGFLAQHLPKPGGSYWVCDHDVGPDGLRNEQLYMTIDEQAAVLTEAGFGRVEMLLKLSGMVLHRAT